MIETAIVIRGTCNRVLARRGRQLDAPAVEFAHKRPSSASADRARWRAYKKKSSLSLHSCCTTCSTLTCLCVFADLRVNSLIPCRPASHSKVTYLSLPACCPIVWSGSSRSCVPDERRPCLSNNVNNKSDAPQLLVTAPWYACVCLRADVWAPELVLSWL